MPVYHPAALLRIPGYDERRGRTLRIVMKYRELVDPRHIHHICREQVVDLNFSFSREDWKQKDTHGWSMDMPCPLFVCFKAGIKTPDFVVWGKSGLRFS